MTVDFWENPSGRSPVEEFIESLPLKAQKKIVKILELLEKHDTKLMFSGYMKKLKGYDLYELRIVFSKVYYRILFVIIDSACILLHAFTKKSDDTPVREIETALARAKQIQPIN